MIQTFHNQYQICSADGSEITILRNVLSDQAIHVLVCTSFPGSIWVSEKEIRLQFLGDPFVFSKLLAIIRGEGMQAIRNWLVFQTIKENRKKPFRIARLVLAYVIESITKMAYGELGSKKVGRVLC